MFKKCNKPVFKEYQFPEFASDAVVDHEFWMNYKSYYAVMQLKRGVLWCSIIRLGCSCNIMYAMIQSIEKLFTQYKYIGFCYDVGYKSEILINRIRMYNKFELVNEFIENGKNHVVLQLKKESDFSEDTRKNKRSSDNSSGRCSVRN